MPSKLWQLDPRFDPDLLAERDRRYVADSSPDVGGLHQQRHRHGLEPATGASPEAEELDGGWRGTGGGGFEA